MPKILNENTFADILITKLLERAGEPLLPLLPLLPDRFLVPESDWTMQRTSSPQALASAAPLQLAHSLLISTSHTQFARTTILKVRAPRWVELRWEGLMLSSSSTKQLCPGARLHPKQSTALLPQLL